MLGNRAIDSVMSTNITGNARYANVFTTNCGTDTHQLPLNGCTNEMYMPW